MNRGRWFLHIVSRSLLARKGRSLLLLTVVAMAAALVTALGIVSDTMGRRVAEEVRRYGANLVVIPHSARLDVGSGGLSFGDVSEPAYLSQEKIVRALADHRELIVDYSLHLKGVLQRSGLDIPVEGVNFAEIRRLFPWWQVKGDWPAGDGAVIGTDLAASLSLREGDAVTLAGAAGELTVRVAGVVSSGGEEDKLLFLPLTDLQRALGREGEVSQVRLMAKTGGERLERVALLLQAGMETARVMEVRQVARTSEGLLRKVQLLMLLVTAIVLITSGGSVASTMSTTVLERGREIGLLKAIGGTRRGVVAIFAAEALFFGLLGGIAGYLLGVAFAAVVAKSVFAAASGFAPLYLPISLAVGLLLTLGGSLGPMMGVFSLDPVRSLRGE